MRDRWAVILAGGDGTRLQSMTRAITGDNRPKQFVPVIGGSTLLNQTRRRVALSINGERTLIVVTQKHRRFYEQLAHEISPNLLVEQPVNKVTAPAILYALLRVATKSPKAVVALFPYSRVVRLRGPVIFPERVVRRSGDAFALRRSTCGWAQLITRLCAWSD